MVMGWFRRKAQRLPQGMADLHNHILPALDDGSESVEETLNMLQCYVDAGFSTIVSTSHLNHPYFTDVTLERILEGVERVKQLIQEHQIPLELHAGAEIYYQGDFMDMIADNRLLSLGSSSYMLIEFGVADHMRHMKELAFELSLKGVRPILAHPERYQRLMAKPSLASEWRRAGWIFQLDLSSLLKQASKPSRKLAHTLLKNRMFELAASDMHHPPVSADTDLKKQLSLLIKQVGFEETERLMVTNPNRIVKGGNVIVIDDDD